MKGEWFEVKTAALLYLRGINGNLEFHLGSNIEQARNFDDIVIKYRNRDDENSPWHTCFIQLKHKERALLDAGMFTFSDRGGFSLKKYLKSFSDIKSMIHVGRDHDLFKGPFETCDFVIYTNAPMVRELAERRRNVNKRPVQDLLKTHQRQEVIVEFCEESDSDIYQELERSGGSEATEFLKKLTVFSGQPSEDRMDEVIKEELKITCSDNMSDVDVIYRFFIEAVKQWWSEDEVKFLSHNSSLLEKALDQYKVFAISSHEKQTHRLNVKFQTNSLEELKGILSKSSSAVFISCVDMAAELVCTKVMQILREEKGSYTFVGLESLVNKKQAVIHGWSTGMQPNLVVLCNSVGEYRELCEEIRDVLQNNANKRVVLVFRPDEVFAKALKKAMVEKHLRCIERQELTNLSDLDSDSIDRILETEILLQSKKVTLRSVLREGLHESEHVLKRHLAEIMSRNAPLSIGHPLCEKSEGVTRRYIERQDVLNAYILKSSRVSGIIAVSNVTIPQLQTIVNPGTKVGSLLDSLNTPVKFVAISSSGSVTVMGYSKAKQDFYTLCKHNEIVHWVSIENDQLIWKRSKGDLADVKQFIRDGECTANNPRSTLDLSDKVALIVEETSSERTSLAAYLATRTKDVYPSFWVLKVNLNEHVTLIKETLLEDTDLIAFLASATCMNTECRIQTEFLDFCLRFAKNVVVVFEHYDAIPEDCQAIVVQIVQQLLKTNVFQVLITTSSSTKEFLEDKLCTIAYTSRELNLAQEVEHKLRF